MSKPSNLEKWSWVAGIIGTIITIFAIIVPFFSKKDLELKPNVPEQIVPHTKPPPQTNSTSKSVDIEGKWALSHAETLVTTELQKKEWNTKNFGDPPYEHKLLDEYHLVYENGQAIVLAYQTRPVGFECHACAPYLSFFEFEKLSHGWKLIDSEIAAVQIGSWGNFPAEGMSVRVIANNLYGVFLESNYMAQGYTSGSVTLFARIGDSFREILNLQLSQGNPDGYGWSSTYTMESTSTGFYEIFVKRKGNYGAKNLKWINGNGLEESKANVADRNGNVRTEDIFYFNGKQYVLATHTSTPESAPIRPSTIHDPSTPVAREYKEVYFLPSTLHLGDEDYEGWEMLIGPCALGSFYVELPLHTLTLELETFGTESHNTISLNSNEVAILPPQGIGQPNEWSESRSVSLPINYLIQGKNTFSICSELVEIEPSFVGDKDDFQIRNIRIYVQAKVVQNGFDFEESQDSLNVRNKESHKPPSDSQLDPEQALQTLESPPSPPFNVPLTWGGAFNQTEFEKGPTATYPIRLSITSIDDSRFSGEIEWHTPRLNFEKRQMVGTISSELDNICAYEELFDNTKEKVFVTFEEEHVLGRVEAVGKFYAQIDSDGLICGFWSYLGGARIIQPGKIILLPAEKDKLTPIESIITYYELLIAGNYKSAWPMLSAAFQKRNHNNEEIFISNILAEKYCDLEVLEVVPVPLESSSGTVRVSATLMSGKKQDDKCVRSSLALIYVMIKDESLGFWRIDAVRNVQNQSRVTEIDIAGLEQNSSNNEKETFAQLLTSTDVKIDAFRVLLSTSLIDVNNQDHQGRTPLMFAARYNNSYEIMLELLNQGANPSLKDKQEKIAFDYLRENPAFKQLFSRQQPLVQPDLSSVNTAAYVYNFTDSVQKRINLVGQTCNIYNSIPKTRLCYRHNARSFEEFRLLWEMGAEWQGVFETTSSWYKKGDVWVRDYTFSYQREHYRYQVEYHPSGLTVIEYSAL